MAFQFTAILTTGSTNVPAEDIKLLAVKVFGQKIGDVIRAAKVFPDIPPHLGTAKIVCIEFPKDDFVSDAEIEQFKEEVMKLGAFSTIQVAPRRDVVTR